MHRNESLCRVGVLQLCVNLASSLPREIHDMPDGSQFVDTALLDILRQPRMAGIRMTDRIVTVLRENRYRGVLIPFFILTAEVVLKCARAGTQKSQPVPTACAGMASQTHGIGRSDDRQIEVLSEMMRHAIESVDPGSAHRAGGYLLFAEHELVQHDRSI